VDSKELEAFKAIYIVCRTAAERKRPVTVEGWPYFREDGYMFLVVIKLTGPVDLDAIK
jgi:hypothetical protein